MVRREKRRDVQSDSTSAFPSSYASSVPHQEDNNNASSSPPRASRKRTRHEADEHNLKESELQEEEPTQPPPQKIRKTAATHSVSQHTQAPVSHQPSSVEPNSKRISSPLSSPEHTQPMAVDEEDDGGVEIVVDDTPVGDLLNDNADEGHDTESHSLGTSSTQGLPLASDGPKHYFWGTAITHEEVSKRFIGLLIYY